MEELVIILVCAFAMTMGGLIGSSLKSDSVKQEISISCEKLGQVIIQDKVFICSTKP